MKYSLTNEYKIVGDGVKVYRVHYTDPEALEIVGYQYGWIQGYHNLSQEGMSCVLQDAVVFGNAQILEDARLYERAMVYDNAIIKGSSQVRDDSKCYGDCVLDGTSSTYGNAEVLGKAIFNNTIIGSDKDKKFIVNWDFTMDGSFIMNNNRASPFPHQ